MTARRALWPLFLAMAVAGPAAVVASAITLATLARHGGWPGWTPWLLPATVDVAGFACGWAWLRPSVPAPARRFGRFAFYAFAAGSLAGNGVGHLVSTGWIRPGPALIVVVGAVPAAVLVALGHLAALALTPDPVDAPAVEDTPARSKAEPQDLESAPDSPSSPQVLPDPAPAPRAPRSAPPPRRTPAPPRASAVDREAAAWALADRLRDPERGGHPGHRITAAEVKAELRKAGGPGVSNGDAGRLARLVNGDRGPAADTAADDDEPAGERVA